MTNKEAISIIENEKKCVNRAKKNDYCNRDCYNCELVKTDAEILEALDMAIKALESKDVLDKIRAEIEQLPTNTRTNWDGCCPDIDYPQIEYVDVTKDKLLSIIDKYKTESEEV